MLKISLLSKLKMSQSAEHKQGKHPNSLKNLTYHEGRKAKYGKNKSKRGVTLTDEGWEGIRNLAVEHGCSSASDFLEKIGRGLMEVKASA